MTSDVLVQAACVARSGFLSSVQDVLPFALAVRPERRHDFCRQSGFMVRLFANAMADLIPNQVIRRFLHRQRRNDRYFMVSPVKYDLVAATLAVLRSSVTEIIAVGGEGVAAQALELVRDVDRAHHSMREDAILELWPDMPNPLRVQVRFVCQAGTPWSCEISSPRYFHCSVAWSRAISADPVARAAYAGMFLRDVVDLWRPAVRARILVDAGILDIRAKWATVSRIVGRGCNARHRDSFLREFETVDIDLVRQKAAPILNAFNAPRLEDARAQINPMRSVFGIDASDPTSYYMQTMSDEDALVIVQQHLGHAPTGTERVAAES